MNEPKLRFKADDGSQFPDWERKCLSDIASFHSGLTYTQDDVVDSENGILVFRSSNIQNGRISYNDNVYVDKELKERNYVKLHDIVVCVRNGSKALVGKNALVTESDLNATWGAFMTVIRAKQNYEFVHQYLNSTFFKKEMYKDSGTATINQITTAMLNDCKLFVPSLPEQQKIAEFLSTIDTVIAKQKETVSAWEERKKGVMQKLFSQEVRFKADDESDFPEWEEKKLGEVMSVKDVKQIPTEEAPLMAFIAYQGVAEKGDRYDRSFLVKSDDKKYKRTDFNDFIYSSNNLDVGSIGLNKYGSAVISVVYEIFTFKDGFNPDCMNLLIQQPRIMSSIIRYRQGCLYGQYKIHSRDFLNVLISAPCLAEQQKIADCLSSLDEVIEKQKATLAAWEELKKGLLQQMFV